MKKTIVINGFYGHGNAGDEAIFQTMRQYLEPQFRLVASTDADLKGMHGNSQYSGVGLTGANNRTVFDQEHVTGLIVGGGGLGIGFGATQLLMASYRNKKLISVGCGIYEKFPKESRTYPAFLEMNRLYHYMNVRDRHSKTVLDHYGLPSDIGADLVFGLNALPWKLPEDYSDTLLLTIREDMVDMPNTLNYFNSIEDFATKEGLRLRIVSYCESEHRRIGQSGYKKYLIGHRLFEEPRKLKYLVAQCAMTISMRRLHASIFSLAEHVPSVMVNPLADKGEINKFSTLYADNGLMELYVDKKVSQDEFQQVLFKALRYDKSRLVEKADLNREKVEYAYRMVKRSIIT